MSCEETNKELLKKHQKNIYDIAKKHLECWEYDTGDWLDCLAIPKDQKFYEFVVVEIMKYINKNNLLFLSKCIKDKEGDFVVYGIKLNR